MSRNPLQSPFPAKFPYYELSAQNHDHQGFQLSDFLIFNDCSGEPAASAAAAPAVGFSENSMHEVFHDSIQNGSADAGSTTTTTAAATTMNIENGMKNIRMETGFRIAFRTKSELENLDDGFKWRKYGKKTVKNSPNPRNYYRCSTTGCSVKKRIERDREDISYVITTYEGVHNHESPGLIYCTPHHNSPVTLPDPSPLEVPQTWSLQTAYSTL